MTTYLAFPFPGNNLAGVVVSGTPSTGQTLTATSPTTADWQTSLGLQATTGVDGFALQDATPTILSWTAPDDGNLHRVLFVTSLYVSSASTGGQVNCYGGLPQGGNAYNEIAAATHAAGAEFGNACWLIVGPGQPAVIYQASALTAGDAILYAEIWGS